MELTKIFENIMNESSLKEHFFYATPHHEEDEEDNIIGYIAAIRDYQTRKTKYIDDDGNICNNKSKAKIFDTKGKADYYSYEHCPEGWTHFVATLKKSDVLNESDDTYKAKRLKEAKLTVGDFCDNIGIENPEAFRDFLRKLWDFDHVELWSMSSLDSLEIALDKYEKLNNKTYRTKFGDSFKGANMTVGEFCDIKDIKNPENFRDFLRKLWDFDHVELWSTSSYDGLERALAKYKELNEAETTKYMACCYDPEDYYEETSYIDEDGELSCNSSGAKLFDTEDEAIEYAEDNIPYGWVSFAMPFNATLNESDDTYKSKR